MSDSRPPVVDVCAATWFVVLYLVIDRQTMETYPNGNAWCRDFGSPSKSVILVVYLWFTGFRNFTGS
jgi:hypothetical protein